MVTLVCCVMFKHIYVYIYIYFFVVVVEVLMFYLSFLSLQEFKLMYGMLFSLKSFIKKLSPTDVKEGFLSYQTSKYKLHYYETPTGIKIVMNTDIAVGNVRDVLQRAYSTIYVDFVVRNPLCSLDEPIQSELFKQKIDAFVRGLPFFSARVT
uniref:Trafficking protein particle complex subunit n=1 Tax=Eptatretus burgeri TaxID=7764 RepID=A0A8C4X1N9_EPTBU